jgi:hypothetical protein
MPCQAKARPGLAEKLRPAAQRSELAADGPGEQACWPSQILHRLNSESLDVPGGHSPMLSRPAALADALIAVANERSIPSAGGL